MRIPSGNTEDVVAWHYEKSSIFTVKSAYKLALSMRTNENSQASSSTRDAFDRNLWDLIWKTKVPGNIKIFGWRVASKSLATKENKLKRTLGYDNVCDLCGPETGNEFHASVTSHEAHMETLEGTRIPLDG